MPRGAGLQNGAPLAFDRAQWCNGKRHQMRCRSLSLHLISHRRPCARVSSSPTAPPRSTLPVFN